MKKNSRITVLVITVAMIVMASTPVQATKVKGKLTWSLSKPKAKTECDIGGIVQASIFAYDKKSNLVDSKVSSAKAQSVSAKATKKGASAKGYYCVMNTNYTLLASFKSPIRSKGKDYSGSKSF